MSDSEQLRRDIALASSIKKLDVKYDALLSGITTVKALVEANKREVSRILNLPKGDKGDRGDVGPRGLTGKDGRDGKDGKDGKDGHTPIKGVDFLTPRDKEELLLATLARIRMPKDGENAIVDEAKIANSVITLIRDKQLLDTDSIRGLRGEITSYRHQMAMKQAGQHGGGDTIVAGTNIQITNLANGTKQISAIGAGTGSVTDVSVVSANGFAGSVATSTTTPAITISTTVTGLLKGNGTAVSAAVANTDYQVPITLTTTGSSGAATFNGTTLNIPQYAGGGGGTVDTVVGTTDRITVDSTDPANPIVDIAATYVGQSSITTLGTIGTGTWNATAIAVNKIAAITASRAVVSDGSGFISASATTSTEIGYVSGVTSAIQTQLNAKQATITFGTGVQTALGVNVGSVGAVVVNGGALGTPSSGTVTNLTGTASININGTVGATTPTTATFTTATINTSLLPDANDGAVLGAAATAWSDLFLASGAVIGFANGNAVITHSSGILTVSTGDLRVTTAGTNTASVVTVGGTQTLTGKTLTSPVIGTIASNTLTLGTGTFTTLTFDAGASDPVITASSGVLTVSTGDLRVTTAGTNSASVVTNAGTQTLTNKRPQPRTASSTTASTLTPDLSSANVYFRTTQTATLTINAPTGTPVIGETIAIYVDSAGAQTLTIDATYKVFGAAFPATTTAGKTFMLTAQFNGTDWKTLWANAV